MKKLVSLLIVLCMAITLFGCDQVKEETSITIKYETNGGTVMADSKISLDTIGSFTLPADPTKEGYVFDGWYIDENFENQYKNIDITTGTFTIYAKWAEEGKIIIPPTPTVTGDGIDATFKFAFDFMLKNTYQNLNSKEKSEAEIQETKVNAEAEIRFACENLKVEKLEDLKAMLNCTVEFILPAEEDSETAVAVPTTMTLQVYVKDGFAYVSIPMMEMSMKIEISKVLTALEESMNEMIPEDVIPEGELTEENIQKAVTDAIAELTTKLAELGIDEEFIADAVELLKVLAPQYKKEGLAFTYEITEEQVNTFCDNALDFVMDNFELISTLVYGKAENDKDTWEIEGFGTFKSGEAKYTDEEGIVHEFKDCDELYKFGSIDENYGLIYIYFTGEYFDSTTYEYLTNEKVKEIMHSKPLTYYTGDVYKWGEAKCTDSEGVVHEFKDDTDEMYGYINEMNLYYCYATEEYFDSTTWKLVTEEEYNELQMKTVKENIEKMFDIYKEAITINECKVSYLVKENGEPDKITFSLDVDVKLDNSSEETMRKNEVAVDVDASIEFTAFEYTVTFPTFDEKYVDMTEMIISSLSQKELVK